LSNIFFLVFKLSTKEQREIESLEEKKKEKKRLKKEKYLLFDGDGLPFKKNLDTLSFKSLKIN